MSDGTPAPSAAAPTATPSSTPAATPSSQPNAAPAVSATADAPAPTTTTTTGDKPAADAPGAEADQLLFTEEKPADPNAEKKDGEGDAAKEGEQAAPETVKLEELKLPEEFTIPEEMKGPLTEYISENKLDKEKAQKLTDLGVKMQQHNLKQWTDTKQSWRKEVENDPVIGGNNLKSSVSKANDVIRKFGGSAENIEALKQDLVLLGLGNKLSFIRLLNNVANATGNDTTSPSSGAKFDDKSEEAMAARRYGDGK